MTPRCHACGATGERYQPVITTDRRWVCGACQAAICPACGDAPQADDILCTPCRALVPKRTRRGTSGRK